MKWISNSGMMTGMTTENFALASVILTNLKSIPSRSQILMNPNVLIADTGSTDNTTGSMLGAFHVRRYKGPPTKTATNEDMVIKAEFDFKGMITDRYGHEQQLALFENFKYIPNAPYTLVARLVNIC